jgi:hypothetical protein
MEALTAFFMLVVIGALAGTATAYGIVKGPGVAAWIFGLDAGPSWPRGVQEDDAPPRRKLNRPSS